MLTVSRATGEFEARVLDRVATSPLKSCMVQAKVKVARGGVEVEFDPWDS